jgi:hypothetical protein
MIGDAAKECTDAAAILPPALPRKEPSALARALGTVFALFVLRPLLWVLRLTGYWPRALPRASARMAEEFVGFAPTAHDVLVCSYFKSGTNWTMQIALQIAWRGSAEFEHVHDVVPWVELPERLGYTVAVCDALWRAAPTQLRVIKTHLPIGKIAYDEAAKYVWVVRDPKDVFVSSYYFIRSILLGPLMIPLDEWLDIFLSEHTFSGSWAEHLHSGWQLRERDNVLFLTYEEMKLDRAAAVDRIAALMGVSLAPAERDAVLARSSYEHMKAISRKFDTIGLSPPWVDPHGTMIRAGRAGGSGELLTPEQQKRIDDFWRAELLRLGSDFPYDAHYGTPGLAKD